MAVKLIDLPNGRDVTCFKGKDAEGKSIKKYVCAMSPRQDAVELAFIDLTQGKPSISHIVYKKYGPEQRPEFTKHLSEEGHKRFRDISSVENEELQMLEEAIENGR
jgi:hypothetical protein